MTDSSPGNVQLLSQIFLSHGQMARESKMALTRSKDSIALRPVLISAFERDAFGGCRCLSKALMKPRFDVTAGHIRFHF